MSSPVSFDIVTSMSPDYETARRLFVPSWLRHSGVSTVQVMPVDGLDWYARIAARNRNLAWAVIEAANWRRCLLSLDIDCIVVRPLSDGFDGLHPIAVARRPIPNMGVAFFDTRVKFKWDAFFGPLLAAIEKRCADSSIKGRLGQKGRFGDQYCWAKALAALGDQVRWLTPVEEWNFCEQPEQWDRRLEVCRNIVRVIHIKGRGDWHGKRIQNELAVVRRLFPGEVEG